MNLLSNPRLGQLLMLGSQGPEVRMLQEKLNQFGLPRVTVDGRFGMRTAESVKQYQRRNGLKHDGIVGPKTAKALGWGQFAAPMIPHKISAKVPSLPPMTPPLMVVYEAIDAGIKHMYGKLKDGLAKSGANPAFIVRATAQIQQILASQLAELKRILSTERPDMLSIHGIMGLGFKFDDVLQTMQKEIDMSGGDHNEFWKVQQFRYSTTFQLGPIVQDLMYGNQSVAVTIQKIKAMFSKEYGPY